MSLTELLNDASAYSCFTEVGLEEFTNADFTSINDDEFKRLLHNYRASRDALTIYIESKLPNREEMEDQINGQTRPHDGPTLSTDMFLEGSVESELPQTLEL